jgi:hypothetical protein
MAYTVGQQRNIASAFNIAAGMVLMTEQYVVRPYAVPVGEDEVRISHLQAHNT